MVSAAIHGHVYCTVQYIFTAGFCSVSRLDSLQKW